MGLEILNLADASRSSGKIATTLEVNVQGLHALCDISLVGFTFLFTGEKMPWSHKTVKGQKDALRSGEGQTTAYDDRGQGYNPVAPLEFVGVGEHPHAFRMTKPLEPAACGLL